MQRLRSLEGAVASLEKVVVHKVWQARHASLESSLLLVAVLEKARASDELEKGPEDLRPKFEIKEDSSAGKPISEARKSIEIALNALQHENTTSAQAAMVSIASSLSVAVANNLNKKTPAYEHHQVRQTDFKF